jgi:hypothetical protein
VHEERHDLKSGDSGPDQREREREREKMTCEMGRGLSMESTRDQAAMRSGLFWEDPTTDQGACGSALLSLQSNAHPSSSPSLHGFYGECLYTYLSPPDLLVIAQSVLQESA